MGQQEREPPDGVCRLSAIDSRPDDLHPYGSDGFSPGPTGPSSDDDDGLTERIEGLTHLLQAVRENRQLARGHETGDEAQSDGRDVCSSDSNSGTTADAWRGPKYGSPELNARLATDEWTDGFSDRYRFEGSVITWGGAVEQYKNERKGQEASAEANGWRETLHQRARRKCAVAHQADRTIRPALDEPPMSFLTFAGAYDPTRDDRYAHIIDYTVELAEAVNATMATHRYQVRRECPTEYLMILGGTERGVPHYHMVGWHNGELDRD